MSISEPLTDPVKVSLSFDIKKKKLYISKIVFNGLLELDFLHLCFIQALQTRLDCIECGMVIITRTFNKIRLMLVLFF